MIFRNWVLENFPFLEDDFDALTDYELFCKICGYVIEYSKDNEEMKAKINEFQHYFDNLDVQEEINNKLDEMALDGTLENLISQYIQLATTYVYDSVNDMQESTNLVDGSFARTSGFYSYNDGGGAYYKIRTIINTDNPDGITLIALDNSTLVAELIILGEMNVKQFGAKGDGETDDSVSIQTAFNTAKNILISNGTYMVDSEDGISPTSNSNIKIVNATIESIPNSLNEYKVLYINGVSNVSIIGGIIKGDRENHTGATGEWGHCIYINNSSNISIKNCKLIDAWGDGLYLKSGNNIVTENLHIDNTRRNGITIISVDGYKSINDYIEGVIGTNPQAGLDIEPNNNTENIKNVIIDNMSIYNCVGDGIDISLQNLTNDCNIILNNCIIDSCNKGLVSGHMSTLKGEIIVNNIHVTNVNDNGIDLAPRYSSDGLKMILINPYVKNFNLNNTATRYGIIMGVGDTDWGNVYIKNPYVETTNEVKDNCYGIVIGGNSSHHPINVIVDTPLNKQLNIFNAYGNNVKIIDPLEYYKKDTITDNTYSNPDNDVNTVFTNLNNTAGGKIYPRNYTSMGLDVKYLKLSDNWFTIELPNGHYCHALSNNTPVKITLTNIGDSITLRRVTSTEWIPVNIVGTPTITN